MTGLKNVVDGVKHEFEYVFDSVYHGLITLFSPVAASVATAFRENGSADFASFMVDVGAAVNAGKTGNDLLQEIEAAAEKQAVKLGGQVLKAFAASVEFNFAPKASPADDPGAPPADAIAQAQAATGVAG